MFIEQYYNQLSDEKINFTRQQASDFAKKVADDFNPLHNIDAKRFCVPGDLLFAVILAKAGLYQQMSFNFSGMVTDSTILKFPQKIHNNASIIDENNKEYLNIVASGECTTNQALITSLIKAYVEFSGQTFPHILVKLMAEHNVMINPTRPMIMYQDISIDMFTLTANNISLRLAKTSLTLEGKRGDAWLEFDLLSDNKIIGQGKKHMLLSGLRPYCQETIRQVIEQYNHSKVAFTEQV